jgi:glycosyltransferase involved in cell wall biosynthesis
VIFAYHQIHYIGYVLFILANMKILFPYLARWRSANRSRYHQLLSHLCDFGHQIYVLNAPTMAINDISAKDVSGQEDALPSGMTVGELNTPELLRTFWTTPIRRTKLLKKGLVSITSISQIRRFIDKENIDVLLLYNLPQVPLLHLVECRTHFDLADDLVAMMEVEDGFTAKAGGKLLARIVQTHMISKADTVTVASSILEDQTEREVLMLPNGADCEYLDEVDGSQWRSKGLGPTVGFVGAFEYWVDFDLVIQVARKLPGVHFVLVGSGRRYDYVRQQVDLLGLRNVTLTGVLPYDQAMSYAAGVDVCILPFNHGPVADGSCPLKLFEYAALRKPIVSTSTQEVMKIGEGWISFADNPEDFAGAIEAFLADSSAASFSAGTGRTLVEQRYNWKLLARQFESLLLNGAVTDLEASSARGKILEELES